jgi:hypothetical protein
VVLAAVGVCLVAAGVASSASLVSAAGGGLLGLVFAVLGARRPPGQPGR